MTAASSPFRPGQLVHQLAFPHRQGLVRAVAGTGVNTRVTVALTGWTLVILPASRLGLGPYVH